MPSAKTREGFGRWFQASHTACDPLTVDEGGLAISPYSQSKWGYIYIDVFVLKAGRRTSSVVSEMTLSLARKTRPRKNHDARVDARAASCAQLTGNTTATKTEASKHVCILHELCGVSNNRCTTKYFVCKPQTCQLEAPTFNFLWSFLRIQRSTTFTTSVGIYLGVQNAHRRSISRACACGDVELLLITDHTMECGKSKQQQ